MIQCLAAAEVDSILMLFVSFLFGVTVDTEAGMIAHSQSVVRPATQAWPIALPGVCPDSL